MKLSFALRHARVGAQSRPRIELFRIGYSSQWSRGVSQYEPVRLSNFWVPTGGIATTENEDGAEGAHALLVRAGYIRQSHSGLYQFLPLGLRVQAKIEKLIDKHMQNIGACKLALSTLTSEELWKKSGRLQEDRSELFRLTDRKDAKYLLSPTHEEEITSLVGSLVHSHRSLPLMLYQVTRKYRDEARPRAGLLRSREFLMKDLYTFSTTRNEALDQYMTVRRAYAMFFADLGLPVFSAVASSGNIGGDVSHEYHLASPIGEDDVLVCANCGWAGNTEVFGDNDEGTGTVAPSPVVGIEGDPKHECPSCQSHTFKQTKAIELGHTFNLGTKYSAPLEVCLADPSTDTPTIPQPLHMGCHGIGISRIVAAAATYFSDSRGLNWPTSITPFDVIVVPRSKDIHWEAEAIASYLKGFVPSSVKQRVKEHPSKREWQTRESLALEMRKLRWENWKVQKERSNEQPLQEHSITHFNMDEEEQAKLKWSRDGREEEDVDGNTSYNLTKILDPTKVPDVDGGEPGCVDGKQDSPTIILPEDDYDTRTARMGKTGGLDVVLDDRYNKDFIWKLKDADLVGYPIVIVLGRGWSKKRLVEVQCRRRGGFKEEMPLAKVRDRVLRFMEQLSGIAH